MPTRWSSSAHLIIETHKTIIEYTWHLFIQEDFRQKPFRSCHQGSVSLEFCSNSSDSFSSYLRMSFSLSPSNEYSGLISFRIDWFDLLDVKGLSRDFSSTSVWKHQFFGTQPSLWATSYIHTWALEKPKLWLDRPLSAKWSLCFLIHCLGLP